MGQLDAEIERRKAANLRTALVFVSIALVFFAGIIAARLVGDTPFGIGVMSVAVVLFLAFAIGRSIRASDRGTRK